MIAGDLKIKELLKKKMLVIKPIANDTVRENGVDLRIGNEILKLISTDWTYDFMKEMSKDAFYSKSKYADNENFIIEPNTKYLLVTKEYIEMPDNYMAFCCLRSSFARLGLVVPPTVIDAGFKGELTIELTGGSAPIRMPVGTRFLHVIFSETTKVEKPYSGKYQGQRGVTKMKSD
jgi:dCTP deaminase